MSTEENEIVDVLNRLIVKAVVSILIGVVPLLLGSLGVLISNHYGQQALKEQVAKLAAASDETTNKVLIIWNVGGYAERFGRQEDQPKK